MKGILAKAVSGLALVSGLTSSGCAHYFQCVDPCWPQRYTAKSRQEVISAMAPQVQNGHVLDQTLFNTHFEPGTDRLNAAGRAHIDTLIRRRPAPDPRIFLATARDLAYDADKPEKFVEARQDLDSKRVEAVQKYLANQTAGRPQQFEVVVHDPVPPREHADPANRSIRLYHNSSVGSLAGAVSATTASSTGAGGGGNDSGGQGPGGFGTGTGQPTQTPR